MSKIYIITSGCYSDYTVHTVVSSEEKAKQIVDAANRNYGYLNYEYEEFELDEDFAEDSLVTMFYIPKTNEIIDLTEYNERYCKRFFHNWNSGERQIASKTGVEFWSFSDIKNSLEDSYFARSDYKKRDRLANDFSEGLYEVTVNLKYDRSIMEKSVRDRLAAYKAFINNL